MNISTPGIPADWDPCGPSFAEDQIRAYDELRQRDPVAFADATEFRLDRDPSRNLLYGRGPHACPGEGLARVELGAFLDEWLDRVPAYEVRERVRAHHPSGGFSRLLVAWGGA